MRAIRTLNNLQLELREAVGKSPREYDTLEFNEELYNDIKERISEPIFEVARGSMGKEERSERMGALKEMLVEELTEKYEETEYFDTYLKLYFKKIQKEIIRGVVVKEGLRLDGRKQDEIRPIWSKTSYLPRTHGSAIFTRGETQALCTVTLGTKFDEANH